MRGMSDVLTCLKACNLSSGQTALHAHAHTQTHTHTHSHSHNTHIPSILYNLCARGPFNSAQMKLKTPSTATGVGTSNASF